MLHLEVDALRPDVKGAVQKGFLGFAAYVEDREGEISEGNS